MNIDPATLPDGTVCETTALHFPGGYTKLVTLAEVIERGDLTIVRTFSPDPLPSQEVPYDRWPSVRKGARVQIICIDGTVATLTVEGASNGCIESPRHGFPTHAIARVFVLDEPADPDADAKAAIDNALPDGSWTPELVLANLRAAGFDVVKAGA